MLASASPRRRELLQGAGVSFEVEVSRFDEVSLSNLPPLTHARTAARGKALEVARRHVGRWVLAADTVVALDGQTLGKPRDGVEAIAMLKRLSGREHAVITAVCLVAPDGRAASGHGRSVVAFQPLDHAAIADYVAGGEPRDKAGAYAIQGEAGEFVGLVSGAFDTVVGLPLHVVARVGRELACSLLVNSG
ncbi:MAG: nucleoside triphosphate pyrophosphatase [Candidatus Dormibacteria bacterium]